MTNRIEIVELISKFLAGEASPKEAIKLEDWTAASPDNLLYFKETLIIYDMPNIPNQTEAKMAAWQKISSSIERKQAYGKLVRLSLTVAATVLFLVLISFLINRSGSTTADPTIYTAERSEKRIRLPDATEVSLAAGSQLIVLKEFDKSNRELTLIGSAFFSVQRNSLWPLIVHAKPLRIQQAGTKFRVATSKNVDTILISVFEGSALISDTLGSSAYVHVNEQAQYVKSRKQLEVLHDVSKLMDQDALQNKRTENSSLDSLSGPPKQHQDTVKLIPPKEATRTIIKPVPAVKNKVLPKKAIPPTNN